MDIYGQVKEDKFNNRFSIPFRYQGQYEDEETGLYYNRFRYYSPEEGLYISQDPIGLEGGDKFYSYVHDPNGRIDPLGLARGDNKLKPDPNASGPHSSFSRDDNGNIYKYETYDAFTSESGQTFFNPTKRFDGGKPDGTPGADHVNRDGVAVPTPHVNLKGGEVREPTLDEYPNNDRFNNNNGGCGNGN